MIKAPEDTLMDPEYMEYRRTLGKPKKGAEFRDIPMLIMIIQVQEN